MNVIATNIGGGSLPANGRIEISFDRLLLPASITRQTFVLQTSAAAGIPTPPLVSYDPVARVVVITPQDPLVESQSYTLTIGSPSSPTDPNGLRAIDGAELAPGSTRTFGFTAAAAAGTPPPTTTLVDFCKAIVPIFAHNGCYVCHTTPASPTFAAGTLPSYAGLALDTPVGVYMTALGRVAHGSNTGPLAGGGQPAGLLFAQDVPILDPGPGPSGPALDGGVPSTSGDPGHSWLMYKVLMAVPGTTSSDAGPPPPQYTVTCAGGGPCPQPLPDDERQRLAGLILGREMPYSGLNTVSPGLSLDDLETVSQWIAGGAPLPASLSCQ